MPVIKEKIEAFVKAWSGGDYAAALDFCAPQITFQIEGKSPLAGKYTRANVISDLANKWSNLSGKTYLFEAHDILVSDRHATILGSAKVSRAGKTEEYRTVHVVRHEEGTPVAWYEYPRNLYAHDAIWGS
jgi:ketosteroid isomerase-like protein